MRNKFAVELSAVGLSLGNMSEVRLFALVAMHEYSMYMHSLESFRPDLCYRLKISYAIIKINSCLKFKPHVEFVNGKLSIHVPILYRLKKTL